MKVTDFLEKNPYVADMLRNKIPSLGFAPAYMLWFGGGIDKEKAKRGMILAKDLNEISQMLLWCESELKGQYDYDWFWNYVYFELQEDSMHWKLRWG